MLREHHPGHKQKRCVTQPQGTLQRVIKKAQLSYIKKCHQIATGALQKLTPLLPRTTTHSSLRFAGPLPCPVRQRMLRLTFKELLCQTYSRAAKRDRQVLDNHTESLWRTKRRQPS